MRTVGAEQEERGGVYVMPETPGAGLENGTVADLRKLDEAQGG